MATRLTAGLFGLSALCSAENSRVPNQTLTALRAASNKPSSPIRSPPPKTNPHTLPPAFTLAALILIKLLPAPTYSAPKSSSSSPTSSSAPPRCPPLSHSQLGKTYVGVHSISTPTLSSSTPEPQRLPTRRRLSTPSTSPWRPRLHLWRLRPSPMAPPNSSPCARSSTTSASLVSLPAGSWSSTGGARLLTMPAANRHHRPANHTEELVPAC